MKVAADRGRCKGHGQCEVFAPEVFQVDDEALVVVRMVSLDELMRGSVEEAVSHCPEAAIWIEED